MSIIRIEKYLSDFKNKQGLYIIRTKQKELLIELCYKLNYPLSSKIAYIGKAGNTKTSDLQKRAKQEMGWSNFEGATFVRKIGLFLDLDIKDKRNKELKEKTKLFICSHFDIECIVFEENQNIDQIESNYIEKFKPCMNVKKVR